MIEVRTNGGRPRKPKTAELIARAIVSDLLARELSTGDMLPGEAVMLEYYQTSRESLREALRLLETQGLISLRRGPGGGPIVGSVDPANLGRTSTLFFHTAGATYHELFEAWHVGETIFADRAARNPDAGLRAACMEPYLTGGAELPAEGDVYAYLHTSFHAAIASLVDNRVLELTLQVFECVLSNHALMSLDDLWKHHQRLEDEHLEVAQAVVNGWPRRAAEAMERHTRSVVEIITQDATYDVTRLIDWH